MRIDYVVDGSLQGGISLGTSAPVLLAYKHPRYGIGNTESARDVYQIAPIWEFEVI